MIFRRGRGAIVTVGGIGTVTIGSLISRSLRGLNMRRDRGVVVVVAVVAGGDVHGVASRRGGGGGLDGWCRCWCRNDRYGS